ncbi:14-3-3 protein homolog 2-like [Octopus sinensis]|uniref:14-3-3 protein homolog 2-like n=1 Tax=Octopus sinensis TaxID=2607531 RepID=A0A6P7TYR0_9MOLL|nr:14-3-3 protein homolog 2-like [Octopus sinensis]XP_029657601.1 14-3-3 protein homolog 2-like [Octopus sinensis]XP_029657604.1 14-3-3 protein homolog 2-like [Octopus sinensis]
MAEVLSTDARQYYVDESKEAYEQALSIAQNFAVNDTGRLGLALNASVFYYEILEEKDKACSLAKMTFDEAIESLDDLTGFLNSEVSLILQLIQDNYKNWTDKKDGWK